ncbi:MAG TPA: hypothetical protein VJX72_02685 [Candidatus Acidoferrum sp.]|nr:hypothetical protein [Candidatus Acidoferrum sp.]
MVRNDYAGLAGSFVDGEKWHMRKGATFLILSLTLSLVAGLSCRSIIGQEHANANTNAGLASYDVKREVTLTGTVLAFIPTSQVAPLGAHLTLQTRSGALDVHLGDARFLAANHFTIQSGDSLRIIGETVTYGKGTQFVARVVQKGTQALAVRSVAGIPLTYMAPRDGTQPKSQGGSL